MYLALIAIQGLHVAVLRKQSHRGNLLACQDGIQKLQQSKTGCLQRLRHRFCAVGRILHIVLQSRFHGAQQQCGLRHAHHFQRTTGLVQLLFGRAQRAAVQCPQIGMTRLLRFAHKPAGGFHGCVQ